MNNKNENTTFTFYNKENDFEIDITLSESDFEIPSKFSLIISLIRFNESGKSIKNNKFLTSLSKNELVLLKNFYSTKKDIFIREYYNLLKQNYDYLMIDLQKITYNIPSDINLKETPFELFKDVIIYENNVGLRIINILNPFTIDEHEIANFFGIIKKSLGAITQISDDNDYFDYNSNDNSDDSYDYDSDYDSNNYNYQNDSDNYGIHDQLVNYYKDKNNDDYYDPYDSY